MKEARLQPRLIVVECELIQANTSIDALFSIARVYIVGGWAWKNSSFKEYITIDSVEGYNLHDESLTRLYSTLLQIVNERKVLAEVPALNNTLLCNGAVYVPVGLDCVFLERAPPFRKI